MTASSVFSENTPSTHHKPVILGGASASTKSRQSLIAIDHSFLEGSN